MATLSLLPPDQPSSVPAGPTRSAPTNKQTSRAVHLEVPDRAVPTAANTERLPYTGMVGKAHRLAPRADVGFLSRLCLGWPRPWVRSSSESVALIKAKRHQSACRFLGRAWPQPSQRGCAGTPEHTWDGPDLAPSATFQCLWQTHVVSQQARVPPSPRACLNGHITVSEARAGQGPRKELYGGKGDQSFQSWAT